MRKPLAAAMSLAMVLNVLVPTIHPLPARTEPAAPLRHVEQDAGDWLSPAPPPLRSATARMQRISPPAVPPADRSLSVPLIQPGITASTVPSSPSPRAASTPPW